MINSIYKVVYGAYEGYADTTEEAEKMEKKFKVMTENNENEPSSLLKTYDDYMREIRQKNK